RGGQSRLGRGGPVTHAVAGLFVGICIAPVLHILIGASRTTSQTTTHPPGLPAPRAAEHYPEALADRAPSRQIGNSTIAAVFTTAGVVVLGVMASYVLARYDFRGRGAMYSLFAAGLMFPITVAITPLYILVRNLGMMNSLTGIIVPQIAFALRSEERRVGRESIVRRL